MASTELAVDMGQWLYGWYISNRTDYDGIADELGVMFVDTNLEDNKKDILHGVNNLKPTKVRITYGTKKDGLVAGGETADVKIGVCQRMADPALTAAQIKKDLAGKKIKVERRGASVKEYDILNVSVK